MLREEFQTDLERLDAEVVVGGRDAQRAVHAARCLLEEYTSEDHELVVALDAVVRARYASVEREIEVLLARQAPVATDLRRLLGALAVMRAFERIGRNARRIADLASPLPGIDGEADVVGHLRRMGISAESLVSEAVDVFQANDTERAERLARSLDTFDDAGAELLEAVIASSADSEMRPWCMRMLIAARWFERIVDHAANVGERTVYRLTGERRQIDTP